MGLLPPEVENSVRAAAECLKQGGVVVFPTDTVYGVAVDPRVPGALERLYAVKDRDRGKPVPILADGVAAVVGFGAEMGEAERRLAEAYWPGPLTLVLRVGRVCEGFRVPDHEVALAVLRATGSVLRVSSANLSGEPPAVTADEARAAIGTRVDFVLDAGPVQGGVPSTVAQVVDGTVRVIREGAIPESDLWSVAGLARGGHR
jgi:L-threonylcarbamoyladenylate synthase